MKLTGTILVLLLYSIDVWSQELHFQNQSVKIESLAPLTKLSRSEQISKNDVLLVQFKGTPAAKEVELLKHSGLSVLNYFPDNAYVVRNMTPEAYQKLKPLVRGIVQFPASSKISSELPKISIFNQNRWHIVHVILWTEEDRQGFQRELPRHLSILDSEKRYLDIRLKGSDILKLAESGFVESIEPVWEVQLMYADLTEGLFNRLNQAPTFPLTGFETGTRLMGFEDVWRLGYSGQGQSVAVADTGLDRGNNSLSRDFVDGVLGGLPVGVGAQNWHDPMGHGTHVAGSVAARGVHSEGQIKGGAYEARLFALGMWSPILNNLSVPPRISRLFEPALDRGVRIHTNSWGSPANLGAYNSLAVQADEWAWENLDFLALFAAGNSGADKDKNGKIDEGSVSSPGTAKNILTVGSSENQVSQGGIQRPLRDLRPAQENWSAEPIYSSFLSDNPRGIAAFSSRGPTRDQRLKPEVVAPGSNVLASFSQEPGANALWGAYDQFHVFSGGTSMSTPLVAGATAVARQMLIERAQVANPSSSLIKAIMMLGSEDLAPGQYGTGIHRELDIRPDNHQGFGLVQMPKVFRLIESVSFAEGIIEDSAQSFQMSLNLSAGEQFEALMVYTDAPGAANSSRALVNNLDLNIVGPGSFNMSAQSQADNFEYLKIRAPVAGQYQIRVVGSRIAIRHPKLGGQPFSLVFDRH